MRYSTRKKFLWYVVFSFLIGIVPAQMAYADEYDYSSDENLAVYVDMPDFRFENGLAINMKTNAVENGRVDLREAIIPKGIEEIASGHSRDFWWFFIDLFSRGVGRAAGS